MDGVVQRHPLNEALEKYVRYLSVWRDWMSNFVIIENFFIDLWCQNIYSLINHCYIFFSFNFI